MSSSTSLSSVAPSSTVVYFITGGNRGLGFGLTERLSARPDTLVFATAREPSAADKLQQLSAQRGNIRIVQLRADSATDHAAAAAQVEAEAGRVDVIVANAGISDPRTFEPIEALSLEPLRSHLEVNAVGPIRLFGALYPLLRRSSLPKYVVVSSGLGSLAWQANFPSFHVANYGVSKAAVNFLTQRIHVEHPDIIAFPLSPGWVQTDMGNAGAKVAGMEQAPMTVEQSVTGMVQLLDDSTRDTHSGRMWNAEDGTEMPW